MFTAFTNASIYTGTSIERGNAVLAEHGMITGLVPQDAIPSQYSITDLGGRNLAPAFMDLQLYGGNGKLFSQELSVESLQKTYDYCLAGGCTQFMITMATNTQEKFMAGMETVRAYRAQGGKGLLGLHLEGPYINPVKKGAHLEQCVVKPTIDSINELLDRGRDVFKMMTLAPECCSEEVVSLLLENNILVSAGHTNADYATAMKAFDAGITAATHLYNAMSSLQHRAPGMVGAIFNHPQVHSSIVCDGIHVDYAAVAVAKKILGERLFFITDAVTTTTEGEYQHRFNKDHYVVADGTLSGSALTMLQCVHNGVNYAGIDLEEALRMASLYPAQLLGDPARGKIEKGFVCELVAFDDALTTAQVY